MSLKRAAVTMRVSGPDFAAVAAMYLVIQSSFVTVVMSRVIAGDFTLKASTTLANPARSPSDV